MESCLYFLVIVKNNFFARCAMIRLAGRASPVVSAQCDFFAAIVVGTKEERMRLGSKKDGSAALDNAFFQFTIADGTFHRVFSFIDTLWCFVQHSAVSVRHGT